MGRKYGKKNEMKVDFASYNYLIQAIPSFGKTTAIVEIGKKLYGDEGSFLITVGREPLPSHIDGAFGDKATDWDELEEIIEELCENKSEYPETRIVGFDSIGELFRIAENQIVAQYNRTVVAEKKVKSIKQAFGGYQGGEKKVIDLVIETVFKLNDYGYCVIFAGHTKWKQRTDLMTDIEYEQLTSTLDNMYFNAIKEKVNIVAVGYMERELTDLETLKDAFTKKDKTVGKISSEKRVLAFRDESDFSVDCKCHFTSVPNKIDFSVDNFVNAVLDGIKTDLEIKRGIKISSDKLEQLAKQERIDREEQSTKVIENKASTPSNEELVAKIQEVVNSGNVNIEELQKLMKKWKIKSFATPSELPYEGLQEIVSAIN